jgi:hypothetical protein
MHFAACNFLLAIDMATRLLTSTVRIALSSTENLQRYSAMLMPITSCERTQAVMRVFDRFNVDAVASLLILTAIV